MKKTLVSIISLVYFFAATAQSPAQQSESGYNTPGGGVLLEEFTGIHCGFCPQGHAIAKKLMRNHDNVYMIAIH